LNHRSQFNL